MLNCFVVVQSVASGGAGIDVSFRGTNDRLWLAGPPTLLSTAATTIAKKARAGGQLGEAADSNERGRSIGGAGQDSRSGDLFASHGLTRPQHRLAKDVSHRRRVPSSDANVNEY